MTTRKRAAAKVKAAGDGDVRRGGMLTDAGGRPVTDEGGRPVFADGAGGLVLDSAGTPPLGEVTATGTSEPPAEG